MAAFRETLDSIRTVQEFKARETIRSAVAEQATRLQDFVFQINEFQHIGLESSREIIREKDKSKTVITTVDPAKHESFLYPFKIIEKEFHIEPNLGQFNGDAQPAWRLRFDGKLETDEKEDFFPFFEFTRLTSGECLVKFSTQTGEVREFDSRQIPNVQELEEKIKGGYNALADLGIDPYLLNENKLLPSEQML